MFRESQRPAWLGQVSEGQGGGRLVHPRKKQHGRRQVFAVVLPVESSPGQPQGLS